MVGRLNHTIGLVGSTLVVQRLNHTAALVPVTQTSVNVLLSLVVFFRRHLYPSSNYLLFV